MSAGRTLLILSGPSCVGKGPLIAALRRCRPDLPFGQPVLHASRAPRPGEQDGREFRFRGAETIRAYDRGRFFVYRMRDQWRAVDLDELAELARRCERIVIELHPAQVAAFREHPRVSATFVSWRLVAVLLQPMPLDEASADVVAGRMREAQIHRAMRQGKAIDAAELADIAVRAAAAWAEMQPGPEFEHVLVCREPEGSAAWDSDPPAGDAGRALEAVAALLR